MTAKPESTIDRRPLRLALAFALAGVLAAGPALAESAPMRASKPAMPPGHPATSAGAGAAAAPAAPMLHGKVLETMNATNYTYARVATADGEKWIAGPQAAVKVGDEVAWPGGAEMKDFTSKTLGRTFDSILFVDRIVVGGAAGAAAGADAVAAPHGALTAKAADGEEVKGIARAEGGLTVGEIFDRRAELEGKEVTVRGKVVKYNALVMDRNWLHLRDGSKAKGGENDLTVTSDGEATVGSVVVVKGKLVLNKDFGFNYKYDVMVEGAKIKVE